MAASGLAAFLPGIMGSWLLALWTFWLELALLAATVRWESEDGPLGTDTPLPRLSAAVPDCLGILSSLFAEYHAQMVLFIGMPVQLFNTFNHAVPALLCAVFVLTRSLPPSGYYLAGTLLLPSPLGALLLLPYMAYETLFASRRHGNRFPVSVPFWASRFSGSRLLARPSWLSFIPIWTEEGNSPACLMQNMRNLPLRATAASAPSRFRQIRQLPAGPSPGDTAAGALLFQNAGKPVVLHHAGHDGRQPLFPHGHHEQ
ncbi:MAG: hypothetical protein ACLSUW_05125 [Akkermansia sp.]